MFGSEIAWSLGQQSDLSTPWNFIRQSGFVVAATQKNRGARCPVSNFQG